MFEGKVFQGKIKFFSEQKGYGFIIPNHGGEDLFFNYRSMKKPKLAKKLQKEQKVSYTIGICDEKKVVRNLELVPVEPISEVLSEGQVSDDQN